jgi:hypothetical protein
VSPRSKGQRPAGFARFAMKALVAALLLIPALSVGLADPVSDIAFAKKHGGGGDVGIEDFSAPRYSSTITINDNGPASPYGSSITVSGLDGTVKDVNLILRNFTHDRPEDVAVMLLHQGRASILMRQAGGNVALQNANIVLDNDASSTLPDNATIVSNLAYKPFDYAPEPESQFGGSAPNNGDNNANHANRQYLDFFNGTTANGTWTLWVRDELAPIAGAMGGWQLEITTDDDDPFIAIDDYKTKAGKTLRVSASDGVLRTDPDKGAGHLTASLVSGPSKGKLNFHSDGSFTYKPKNDKKGTVTFEYAINDELGASIPGNGEVVIKIKKNKHHEKHKGKHGKKHKHKTKHHRR